MRVSGEEAERRLRRASELRRLVLDLRKAARQAWREGRFPCEPASDVRSDVEYWRAQAARPPQEPPHEPGNSSK